MNVSRRSFLAHTTAAGALGAFPFIRASAQGSANEKINIACIGIGNRGESVVNSLFDTKLCNVVALCDTDMGAKHTRKIMEKFPNAQRFQDFRSQAGAWERERSRQ